MKTWKVHFSCILMLILMACSQKQDQDHLQRTVSADNFEQDLQTLLISADSGAVILMPEGHFELTRSLSLDGVPGITLKGKGKEETVLSFKSQIQGAEGLLLKADNLTLEDFSVEDSKGDGIKIQDSDGLTLRNLRVTWTTGADSTNGGYGIYPVACRKVLIENCEASFASDAGLYVGQCTDVIMRDNFAHHNVAGIEIENSRNVDCYDNLSENNTGGILVFNLPDLPQAFGYSVRVYQNICRSNNFQNFSPKGGMVNILPPGSGITLVAHRDVEIFENEILDHNTLGLGVISYLFTQRPYSTTNGFDPFYQGVNIHHNTFLAGEGPMDSTTEYGQLLSALYQGVPQDILIDGIFNPESSEPPICFSDNGDDLKTSNLNAHLANDVAGWIKNMDRDLSDYQCDMPAIEGVNL